MEDMFIFLGWLLIVLTSIAIFSLMLQVFSAFWFEENWSTDLSSGCPTTYVLMPAHNEEKVIARTLEGYCKNIENNVRIVVIADNCNDETAAIARRFPVTVLERLDNENIGKGFAMQHGLDYLHTLKKPPEVVVFVDADSFLTGNRRFAELATLSVELGYPFQAGYMLMHDRETTPVTRLKSLAWILKNFVRPMGMRALGLNCMLQGNGMVFPWRTICDVKLGSSHIVEDNKLAVDLTRNGVEIGFIPSILFGSYFELSQTAVSTQSRRWEGGALILMARELPQLFREFLVSRKLRLLGPIIELVVPPISLLFSLVILTLAFSLVLGLSLSYWALVPVTACLLGIFTLLILAVWRGWAQSEVYFTDILHSIYYALRKIPFYFSLIFRRVTKWERAVR